MPNIDITVENHGTVFLFTPYTPAASDWIDKNVSDDSQWFGNSLAVEACYAQDLAHGMQQDGLNLQ